MRKLTNNNMENIQGGSIHPHWTDCAFLTAGAIATTILATPIGGAFLGGMAVGCWAHT